MPRGWALAQEWFGFMGDFMVSGFDFRKSPELDGWKSLSLTMVGVMKMSRFCLSNEQIKQISLWLLVGG